MQRVMRKDQAAALLLRKPILYQSQVQILVASVQFIADDRVSDVRQVNANLVLAASPRPHAQQRECLITPR
jgi:hypothetical protein